MFKTHTETQNQKQTVFYPLRFYLVRVYIKTITLKRNKNNIIYKQTLKGRQPFKDLRTTNRREQI